MNCKADVMSDDGELRPIKSSRQLAWKYYEVIFASNPVVRGTLRERLFSACGCGCGMFVSDPPIHVHEIKS